MEKRQLINKLNWFYSLELNQVDLYTAQSKKVDDFYIQKTLERVAVIEQQHVDNIAEKIEDIGGKPTILGDVISPIIGKITGSISGFSGIGNILKLDISIEEVAMKDYKEFILKSGDDQELFNILWANLIDEDLHTSWFASKLKEIGN